MVVPNLCCHVSGRAPRYLVSQLTTGPAIAEYLENLMNIERKWWFKAGVGALTFATAFGLFYLAGQWLFGGRSVCSVVIFFFCLVGLQRLYDGVFGVVAILVAPDR